VRADLNRVRDYARLLASLGINGCSINNVNADSRILQDDFLPQLAQIAAVFRPWGVRRMVAGQDGRDLSSDSRPWRICGQGGL